LEATHRLNKRSDRFKEIPGIIKVVPRIVGRTYGEGKFVAVLGIDSAEIPRAIQVTEGRMPAAKERSFSLARRGAPQCATGANSRCRGGRGRSFLSRDSLRHPHHLGVRPHGNETRGCSDLFAMQGKATDLLIYTRPDTKRCGLIIRLRTQSNARMSLLCEFKPEAYQPLLAQGFISRQGFSQVSIVSCLAWAFPASGLSQDRTRGKKARDRRAQSVRVADTRRPGNGSLENLVSAFSACH